MYTEVAIHIRHILFGINSTYQAFPEEVSAFRWFSLVSALWYVTYMQSLRHTVVYSEPKIFIYQSRNTLNIMALSFILAAKTIIDGARSSVVA